MSDKRNAKLATTNRNEKIRSLEIGERLNDKFHRKWTRSSKMRYGNALLSWSKFLNEKFGNL